MLDVRTIAVENWLRQFRRQDGDDLAYSTKAYSTMLIANGENVNVIQELMRHG